MALKQIVDKAIAPVGVVDVFAAAGLEKPNMSVLSDEFLAEIRGMERKNLAVLALQKLLNDEVRVRFTRNAIRTDDFSKMLEAALTSYKNGTIEAAQVIEELIDIALKMKAATEDDTIEGMEEDEVAFYDALLANGSAKEVMKDDQLRDLARVLVESVRNNTSVDWTIRANAQARLRVEVKKLLSKYGYPPDEQAIATANVLKQAELFAEEWTK